MKKLILLSLLLLVSNQGFAKLCDDGSRPERVISADGSFYESKCKDNKKTSSKKNSDKQKSFYPVAIQSNSFDVFCNKLNLDCSHPDDQKWYRTYFTLPIKKALAIAYPEGRILDGISGANWWYGEKTTSRAKSMALSQCNINKAVYSDKCYILVENNLIVNKDYLKLLNR